MERVSYEVRDGIGWVVMDDGAANVISPAMQEELHQALDRTEADDVVTVIRGRDGVFSGGFDLAVIQGGDVGAMAGMVIGGFELARRVLGHPRPVVMACTGHAVAMGLFLLLGGDYLIGPDGDARIMANEVAIGLTLPRSAGAILRHRLDPAAFERTAMLSMPLDPSSALRVGALDETVAVGDIDDRAAEVAAQLAALDPGAQRATKQRVRSPILAELDTTIAADRGDFDELQAAVDAAG